MLRSRFVRACLLAAAAFSSAIALSSAAAQTAGGYHVVKKIAVGGEGGWDYALVDAAARRLYVSHGTKAVVIDIEKDAVIGEVTPANGIHGIALAPEFNRGFTSNGRDTTVTIFDLKTLATIGSVKVTGANPDAIWYDDASKRVFTFNGSGKNATAIDAAKGEVVGTIALGAKPEFAQNDGKGLLFVNLETDTGQVAVIDTKALRETKRYWLPGCEGPSGLAIDRKNNRLFSVCGNKTMAVSDPATGKVVALVPICAGPDAAAFDPATKMVFASCGGGVMTVVTQESADTYTPLGDAPTQRGSRTMAYDTKTHRAYLAAAEYGQAPAPQPGARPARPPMVPGSFSVIVVEAPAAQGVTVKEEKPGLLTKAGITAEAATATAQARLPTAKLKSAEIEEEKGKLIYSFDFETAGKPGIDEVNVDAMTGTVLAVEHETPKSEAAEAAKGKAKDKAKAPAKKP